MADWPTIDELSARLDLGDSISGDLADIVERDLAAAIEQVKHDVGNWDEYEDQPDDRLSQAALRMAELIATRPEAQPGTLSDDPTYVRLLKGHRRVFGLA